MKLCKTKLSKRISIAKIIGLIIWLIAYFCIPLLFADATYTLRFAVLLWYITLGGLIGIFWVMKSHPVFPKWKFPAWFRWMFLWGWMNFVLVLFIYETLSTLMIGSMFEGYSPFWLVLDWAIVWMIIDTIATKSGWEWKKSFK